MSVSSCSARCASSRPIWRASRQSVVVDSGERQQLVRDDSCPEGHQSEEDHKHDDRLFIFYHRAELYR
jgi:hypothetical protein